jgi:hypothetical protein
MKIVRTALIVASLVTVAASAHAQGFEDLLTNIHGEAAQSETSRAAPYAAIPQPARGAYAQHRARVHPQHR